MRRIRMGGTNIYREMELQREREQREQERQRKHEQEQKANDGRRDVPGDSRAVHRGR
jgi:hypothetical protein